SSCTSRFYCDGVHRDLHSFPTRRSSDLLRVSSFPFTPIIAYVVKFCSRISILSPGRMPSEVKFLVPELTTSDPWDVERSLPTIRSEEHTSELQSRENLVCRLLLEKKKKI